MLSFGVRLHMRQLPPALAQLAGQVGVLLFLVLVYLHPVTRCEDRPAGKHSTTVSAATHRPQHGHLAPQGLARLLQLTNAGILHRPTGVRQTSMYSGQGSRNWAYLVRHQGSIVWDCGKKVSETGASSSNLTPADRHATSRIRRRAAHRPVTSLGQLHHLATQLLALLVDTQIRQRLTPHSDHRPTRNTDLCDPRGLPGLHIVHQLGVARVHQAHLHLALAQLTGRQPVLLLHRAGVDLRASADDMRTVTRSCRGKHPVTHQGVLQLALPHVHLAIVKLVHLLQLGRALITAVVVVTAVAAA